MNNAVHDGFVQYPKFDLTFTLLRIGGVAFPAWSGTGTEQTIDEETAGRLARAADGGLIFFSPFPIGDERNVRLTTRISGNDKFLPPLGFIRPGIAYEVESVAQLPAGTGGIIDAADFERLHVPGSIEYRDASMAAIRSDGEGNLTDPADAPRVAWTFYRPLLLCKLLAKSIGTFSPWTRTASWSIDMREHKPLAKRARRA